MLTSSGELPSLGLGLNNVLFARSRILTPDTPKACFFNVGDGLRTGEHPRTGVRAGQHDWERADERKRFGNHCKAKKFEHQAVANASGQDGRERTLVT
jgi:hypothetical protein